MGLKFIQIHKVDGPHHRLKIYTSPQSGRTPPWVKNLYESTKWTDPTMGLKFIQIQKVNGPSRDQTYAKKGTDPTDVQNPDKHNGRTQPVHKIIQVHNVDSHQGSRPHSTE